MLISLLAVGVLVAVASSLANASCPYTSYTNGCSVPFGLKTAYQGLFTPACNKHDVCYYCAKMYGWNRKQCDGRFYTELKNYCKKYQKKKKKKRRRKRSPWFISRRRRSRRRRRAWWGHVVRRTRYKLCMGHAATYYGSVRAGGWLFYKSSPSWCSQSCSKNFGTPHRTING